VVFDIHRLSFAQRDKDRMNRRFDSAATLLTAM